MSAGTSEVFIFAVVAVAAVLCAGSYVFAVLDGDKLLSRIAAVAFLVFGVVAAIALGRILWA